MQRFHAQAAALLFVHSRDPSSFPAKLQRAVAQAAVPIIVILLVLGAAGVVGRLHAEPAVDAQSQRKSAADPYASFVHEATQRFGIPPSWISAVMAMESGGDVLALSPQGAMGLMQIMPDTWAGLRARHGLGADPYEPRDNILAGAAYLREMHDRYGSPGFLAAYNAGPARYDEYLATGRELPAETELYVAALAPLIGEGQAMGAVTISRRAMSWKDSPLFATRDQSNPAATSSTFRTTLGRTSVSRSVVGVSPLAPQADGLFVRGGNANRLP
ncbi:lytic transglycosylase domain-containing protein [Reyranella sp.]|uniref:lytic transglycosylase domain-containing protein n=1 Tax=Reyranella sp. TaxID=1929291 RepID=UPI003F7072FE